MAKYVPDITSDRWVIIADGRDARPDENKEKDAVEIDNTKKCPFCPGNESMTTEEVYRVGKGHGVENGWEVRVIPNKYPITDIHEIIVHAPCEDDLHHLPKDHLIKIFQTYRNRYNQHSSKGQVVIFCNRGEHAGASIEHPHSQLVVLPYQINISSLSLETIDNIVEQNDDFTLFCPDFSQWPYEAWLSSAKKDSVFGEVTDDEIESLVKMYTRLMERLENIHKTKNKTGREFSYNFYIYPKKNWYIRIIPRFVYRAGFELGTGLSVNPYDPADVAADLRGEVEDYSCKTQEDEVVRLKNKLKALGIEE